MFIAGVNGTGDKLFPEVNDTGDETLATKLACQSEHLVKYHYMSVKSNPTAFQKIWKHFISQKILIYRRCR